MATWPLHSSSRPSDSASRLGCTNRLVKSTEIIEITSTNAKLFAVFLAYPDFTCQSSFYNSPLLVIDNSELTQPNYCKPALLCQLMEGFATKFSQLCNVSVRWGPAYNLCFNVVMLTVSLTATVSDWSRSSPRSHWASEGWIWSWLLLSAVSPYKFACKVYLSTSITQIELINWEHNLSVDRITIITRQKMSNFITPKG